MNKVADDLKFGLTNESAFMSAHSLGQISRELGSLGYKNSELFEVWFDKLTQMYSERNEQSKFMAGPSYEKSVYGNMTNFEPRHYIYQGYQTSNEFRDHLETLMQFETEQKSVSEDPATAELQKQIASLARVAEEVSQVQIDKQSAIDAVRAQYFKLQAAVEQYEFLAESDYVRLNLLELQEMCIKAGYIEPAEILYEGQQEG